MTLHLEPRHEAILRAILSSTAPDCTGQKLFDSFATGAGVGLRLMLNKRPKTNLCFDFGWGREGKALYFAVQEAF